VPRAESTLGRRNLYTSLLRNSDRAPPSPPPPGEQNVSLEEHYARKKAVSARAACFCYAGVDDWSAWLRTGPLGMTAIAGKRVDLSSYTQAEAAHNNQTLSLVLSFSLEVRAAQLRKWIADDCVRCVYSLAAWMAAQRRRRRPRGMCDDKLTRDLKQSSLKLEQWIPIHRKHDESSSIQTIFPFLR